MHHLTKLFATSAIVVMLSACGGGSGDVVVSKPGTALFTSAPATLTMELGSSQSFSISGGGGGSSFTQYSVTSSSPNLVSATVTGTSLKITSLAAGTATLTIKDGSGSAIEIKVNATSTGNFSIQAPASVTLNAGNPTSYKIVGGTPPFVAASSNIGVTTVVVDGSTVLLNPVSIGGAQVMLFDSKGLQASITTAVVNKNGAVPLFATAPSFISLTSDGAKPVYQIGGGTAPYTVSTSAPDIITVQPNGEQFSILPKTNGFSTITIKDAVGANLSVSVSVSSGKEDIPYYSTAPSSVVVKEGTSANYSVSGGVAPYRITTSDISVATVSINNSDFTINGISKGAASIVIKDKLGASIPVSVTVPDATNSVNTPLFTTAPGAVTLNQSTQSTFMISGGKSPYSVSSSNNAVVVGTITDSMLTTSGIGLGNANVIVTDTLGAKVNIAVAVASASASTSTFFTTSPGSLVIKTGNSSTYSIVGGKAPYRVTSSASGVVTSSVTGQDFTLSGVSQGTASVLVVDSNGATINIAVSVPSSSTGQVSTDLFVTASSSVVIKNGNSATFAIGGGTGNYTVSSNNLSVVTTSMSGNNFTLNGVGSGIAKVTIVDTAGKAVTIDITVN